MKSFLVAAVFAVLCYIDVADSQAEDGILNDGYAASGAYGPSGPGGFQYQDGRAAGEAYDRGTAGNIGTDGMQNGRLAAGSNVNLQSNTGVNVNSPGVGWMSADFGLGRQGDRELAWRTGPSGSETATGYGSAAQGVVNGGWNRGGQANGGNVFTDRYANDDTGGKGLNNRWIPRQGGDAINFGRFISDLNNDGGKINDGLIQEATSLITGYAQNGNAGGLLRSGLFPDESKTRNGFVANENTSGPAVVQSYDAKVNFPSRNYAGNKWNRNLGTGANAPLPNSQGAYRPGDIAVEGGPSDGPNKVSNGMVANGETSSINVPSRVQGYDSRSIVPNRNFVRNAWNRPLETGLNVPTAGGQTAGRPGNIPVADGPVNGESNVRDGLAVNRDISGINVPSRMQGYDFRSRLSNINFGRNIWNGRPGTGLSVPPANGLIAGRPGDILVGGGPFDSARQGNSRTVGKTNAMYTGRIRTGSYRGTPDETETGSGFGPIRNDGTGNVGDKLTSLPLTGGQLVPLVSLPSRGIVNGKIPLNLMTSPVTLEGQKVVSPDKSNVNTVPKEIGESPIPESVYGLPGAGVGLLQTNPTTLNGPGRLNGPENSPKLVDLGKGSSAGAPVLGNDNNGNTSGVTENQACGDQVKKGKKKKGKKGKNKGKNKKTKNDSRSKGEEDTNPLSDTDDEDSKLIRILEENGKGAKSLKDDLKDTDLIKK